MMYSFENMKPAKKMLYEKLWGDKKFRSKDFITPKNWTGKESEDSFYIKSSITSFMMSNITSAIATDLANAFDIKDESKRALFTQKTEQACSGSGEEALKITTMHSSSLCSLLCFYGISDKNKLEIKLEDDKTYVFTESYFEFQNEVIKGRSPSNMDVVLVGYEKENINQKVVLFLESKFTEYHSLSSSMSIANSYLANTYGKVIYNKLEKRGIYNIITSNKQDEKEFKFSVPQNQTQKNGKKVSKENVYLEGIKQMISHYIGVRNLLDGNIVSSRNCDIHNEIVKDINEKGAKVLLGTIIFEDLYQESKYFNKYKDRYEEIAKILNEVSRLSDNEKNITSTEQLTILEKPLTYAGVFLSEEGKQFELDEKVKKYYFGND